MKEEAQTEKEMREAKVPWPKTMPELIEYLDSLINRQHDYGTCVYAMSMAAVAAFNYVGSVLGVTGFQASCADLDFLSRTRSMKSGFKIVDYNDFLYPQYANKFNKTLSKETWEGIQHQAKEHIEKADTEYKEYLVKAEQYKKDIAAFVLKYPDYYERKEHYDPLGMGTGDQWAAEKEKKASGFEFAPQPPYKPINNDSPVYRHWISIASGVMPFGFTPE